MDSLCIILAESDTGIGMRAGVTRGVERHQVSHIAAPVNESSVKGFPWTFADRAEC
jgi:hypothetical protein